MLDKTPAWIRWALEQAVMLDIDMAGKLGLLGGKGQEAEKPKTRAEENQMLGKFGFKVKR